MNPNDELDKVRSAWQVQTADFADERARLTRELAEAQALARSFDVNLSNLVRYEAALREIATLTWAPALGLPETSDSELHDIARRALGEES